MHVRVFASSERVLKSFVDYLFIYLHTFLVLDFTHLHRPLQTRIIKSKVEINTFLTCLTLISVPWWQKKKDLIKT